MEEGIQETSFAGEFVGTDLLVIREGVQVSDTGFVRPIRLPYAYYREKKRGKIENPMELEGLPFTCVSLQPNILLMLQKIFYSIFLLFLF